MTSDPILQVQNLSKVHRQGWLPGKKVFSLYADFRIDASSVIGILGPNGSGKSSLFDLIAGHDTPTEGKIFCYGQDMHRVKRTERMKMVHYHRQSQLSRHKRRRFPPNFLLQSAARDTPAIYLYDEPNEGDWITRLFFYTIQGLRDKGNVILFAMHPGRMKHVAMMRGICDSFIYAENGRYTQFASFDDLLAYPPAHRYLAPLAEIG